MSKLKIIVLLFVLLSPALAFSECGGGKYKDCRCNLLANNGEQNVTDVTIKYCCENGCGGMGYAGDPRCCSPGTTWDPAAKTCKTNCTQSYGSWTSATSSTSDTCNGDKVNAYTCAAGPRTCVDVISSTSDTRVFESMYRSQGVYKSMPGTDWLTGQPGYNVHVTLSSFVGYEYTSNTCSLSVGGYTNNSADLSNKCKSVYSGTGTYVCYDSNQLSSSNVWPAIGCKVTGGSKDTTTYQQRTVTCC